MTFQKRISMLAIVLSLPLAVMLLYSPGLSGTFLLDDFYSLEPLGGFGSINTPDKLWYYVFSGNTGPTGRPVSLFTFALNAQSWPAEPYWFLLTNVCIHAVNSLLVYIFLSQLFRWERQTEAAKFIAAFAAIAWALLPFHVSSVLYVVQRMTLLSGTFSILALIFYLFARRDIEDARWGKACVGLALVTLASVVAVFSKETSVLLPLQVLVVELYLRAQRDSGAKGAERILLIAALLASSVVAIYLINFVLKHLWEFYSTGVAPSYGRSFSVSERVLSQLRVLGEYMMDIVIPKSQTAGIFHDNYPVSKGFFSPPSTILWLCFHVGVISLACSVRKSHPLIFFGILWYYASHLLESSVLMLEIKFEHRNYLPSIGLMVVVGYLISLMRKPIFRYAAGGGIILVYSGFLFLNTSLWGKPLEAAVVWVEKNPNSPRALENAARQFVQKNGDIAMAKDFVKRSVLQSKTSTSELRYISAFCETYDGQQIDWDDLSSRLRLEARDWTLYNTLEDVLAAKISGDCDLLELEGYKKLLSAYRDNEVYKNNLSVFLIDEFEIRANLHWGETALAIALEENQLRKLMPLAFAMRRAGIFATEGHLDVAAKSLEVRIRAAEKAANEDKITMSSAKEMLELIKAELAK